MLNANGYLEITGQETLWKGQASSLHLSNQTLTGLREHLILSLQGN